MTTFLEMILILLALLSGVQNIRTEDQFKLVLFDYHLLKKLNVPSTAKQYFVQVSNMMECLGKCKELDWCQSGNFKTTPEKSNFHVCELLPSDQFTPSNSLTDDLAFEHFNLKTPCHVKNMPCVNEGQCTNKGQCKCKEGFSGEQCEKVPPKNCREIHQIDSSLVSGVYSIYPTYPVSTQAIKVYCDMKTDGGGWTLVFSYTFTNYGSFGSGSNAVTPQPTWPSSGDVVKSTTPPLNETHYAAIDFNTWKEIGNELMVKSNINHWIKCQDGTGSLVNWKKGSVTCQIVKNVASKCYNYVPDSLALYTFGPAFIRSSTAYYFFESSTTSGNWPTHDPCGANQKNHLGGVDSPHGNIYVR